MRVLFTNWRDIKNPKHGGAEIYVHEIAKRLVSEHEVLALSSRFPGSPHSEWIDDVHYVRVFPEKLTYFLDFLVRDRCDVVFDTIQVYPTYLLPQMLLNWRSRRKQRRFLILHNTVKEYIWYEKPLASYFIALAEAIFYRFLSQRQAAVDGIITVSEDTAERIREMRIDIPIFVFPNGIDFKDCRSSSAKRSPHFTVIYLGRIRKYKRVEEAIQAFGVVKGKIPDAEMYVVGDGDGNYLRYLKRLAMGISSKSIHFEGYVSEDRKIMLLKKSHVMLMPSLHEGWGRSAAEGMACGVVPVCSDVMGLRTLMNHNVNGFLVDPFGTANNYAEHAILLAQNPLLRESMAEKGIESVRNYSWHECANKFKRLINQVKIA